MARGRLARYAGVSSGTATAGALGLTGPGLAGSFGLAGSARTFAALSKSTALRTLSTNAAGEPIRWSALAVPSSSNMPVTLPATEGCVAETSACSRVPMTTVCCSRGPCGDQKIARFRTH